MLVRDYIEDALYNPNYGYFPKQATIFSGLEEVIDFSKIRDGNEFQDVVAKKYESYGKDGDGPGRQIFHTPTELFRPHFGQAIGQCIVSEYLLKYFPYEDLNLYEIGAGNGSLAMDVLNFIQDRHPEVYERTRYTIIEISASLAERQRQSLSSVHDCVEVVNKSIFRWKRDEPAPCFIVMMEVIDNFAHDMIRYDLKTLEPYQAFVSIDDGGDFHMHYTRITDPLMSSFLSMRLALGHPPPLPAIFRSSRRFRNLFSNFPFVPNLSQPEYIPTRLLSLLSTLRTYFPLHRLILSDFATLPDTVPGYNAPVVQTRYKNTMVPCRSLFVRQGYFDIFFPTNFEQLRDMYEHVLARPNPSMSGGPSASDLPIPPPPRSSPLWHSVSPLTLGSEFFSSRPPNRRSPLDGVVSASGLPVGERKSSVFTHKEFMETYADLERTRLRNGENPMLDYYKNVKFLF
ncbi:DUF185-domain-containing protein [Fomitiporia mediterranea MF3/22]|uniref:DUF185-domain-containing protein n=1 Tax=Fomitiporia mediterranea (strain MF3/22) TaxID=694068 RepID=UPI0004407457|nr:DUF185-domain-containing protein [Fomitiporia mediterranea MF3/22]EJD07611.1 DUF185-domain-containing protein [Fomitiporia mediterranea MF3/22]